MRVSRRRASARIAGGAVTLALIGAGGLACSAKPSINARPHPGSSAASVVDGVQQITVSAGNTYRFDPSVITVHPGRVELILHNTGSGAPHDWSLLGFPGAQAAQVGGGGTSTVTFTAPSPGRYEFVCTIHEKQGQTGTLVVLGS